MPAWTPARLCVRIPTYSSSYASTAYRPISTRLFHSSRIMADLQLSLTAPNGRQYTQPIGLFINNQFVAAKSGDKFATISPAYVLFNTPLYRHTPE